MKNQFFSIIKNRLKIGVVQLLLDVSVGVLSEFQRAKNTSAFDVNNDDKQNLNNFL